MIGKGNGKGKKRMRIDGSGSGGDQSGEENLVLPTIGTVGVWKYTYNIPPEEAVKILALPSLISYGGVLSYTFPRLRSG